MNVYYPTKDNPYIIYNENFNLIRCACSAGRNRSSTMKKYMENNLNNYITLPQYGVSNETRDDNVIKKDNIHLVNDGYYDLFEEYKTKNIHTLILEEMNTNSICLGPSETHPGYLLFEEQNLNDLHDYIDFINFYFWDIGLNNYKNMLENSSNEYFNNVVINTTSQCFTKTIEKNIFFLFNTYKRNILYTINMLNKFNHDTDLVVVLMNDTINKPTNVNIEKKSKDAYLNYIDDVCEVIKIF